MKVIIEYRILHGNALTRDKAPKGVRSIRDEQIPPDQHADFPLQRLEYAVEDGSETARAICELLGVSFPGEHRG